MATTGTWFGAEAEIEAETEAEAASTAAATAAATTRGPNFWPIRLGYFVGIGVIIPIGFIFNTLSIVVLIGSRQLRHSTTGLYLIALSVADTLFLIGEFLRWLDTDSHVPGYTFLVRSDATCRFVFSLRYGAKLTSAWITVAITGERYVIVAFPLKAMTSCTRRMAAATVGVTYVVCFALGSFPVLCLGLDRWAGELECLITDHVWYERGSWIVLRIGSLLLPGLVVVVLTVLITVNLSRATVVRRRTLNEDRSGAAHARAHARSRPPRGSVESQLTAMLLAVALAFIVLRLPYTILYYVNEYKASIWRPIDPHFSYRIYAATKFADLLAAVNYAVNFFLYCLTGSTFRSQLRLVFRCRGRRCGGDGGGGTRSRKSSASAVTHNTAVGNEKLPLSVVQRYYDNRNTDTENDRQRAKPVGDNANSQRPTDEFSHL